jgi:hypothetical protein
VPMWELIFPLRLGNWKGRRDPISSILSTHAMRSPAKNLANFVQILCLPKHPPPIKLDDDTRGPPCAVRLRGQGRDGRPRVRPGERGIPDSHPGR